MNAAKDDDHFLIDEQSFTTLFNTYWEKVYEISYKNIRSHEDAKELTQNIFKSIWERRNELKITGSIEHYLLRSCKLQVITFYRNNSVKAAHAERVLAEYEGTEHSTENVVLFNQLHQRISLVIENLPKQCRTIYQLSRVEHLSNKEIAGRLKIALKTVEYHLSNAKKELKGNLKDFI